MRKWVAVALLAGAGLGYWMTPPRVLAKVGIHKPFQPAAFRLVDTEGKLFEASECRGRPLVLLVGTTDCPYWSAGSDWYNRLLARYGGSHACFFSVSVQQDWETVKRLRSAGNIRFPIAAVWDPANAGNDWNRLPTELWPEETPYVYLLDRKGYLRYETGATAAGADFDVALNDVLIDGSPESELPRDQVVAVGGSQLADERRGIALEGRAMLAARRYDDLERRLAVLESSATMDVDGRLVLDTMLEGLEGPGLESADEQSWRAHLAGLRDWRLTAPGSAWAALVEASSYFYYAWAARGTRYARETSDDSMGLFAERIETSRKAWSEAGLLGAASLRKYHRLNLALGRCDRTSKDDQKRAFEEALKVDPNYRPFFMQQSAFLSPQWHGSWEEWRAFVDDSVARTRGAFGDALLCDLVGEEFSLNGPHPVEDALTDGGFAWQVLQRSCEEHVRRFPSSEHSLNRLALFAAAVGDRKTALAAFEKIGRAYDPLVWRGRETFDFYKAKAEKRTLAERVRGWIPGGKGGA